MFGIDPLSRDDRSEAEQLHDYLDDLAAGVLAPGGPIDPDLAATATEINTAGRQPLAPAGLKTQVWEELMSSRSISLPVPNQRAQRSTRSGAMSSDRVGQFRPSAYLPSRFNFSTVATIVAFVAVLGGIGGFLLRSGSGGDPGPTVIPAAVAQASPEAGAEKRYFERCTTNPPVELKDVFNIVNSAVFQTPYYSGGDREASTPVAFPATVGSDDTPAPTGTNADAATRQAVTDTYLAFRVCSGGGLSLEALSLLTPNGIARLMIPGGDAIDFSVIVSLGLETQNGLADPAPNLQTWTDEIDTVQQLSDGRVVLTLKESSVNPAVTSLRYLIFVNVDGQWMIDDLHWFGIG